jgi:hypothetical protein
MRVSVAEVRAAGRSLWFEPGGVNVTMLTIKLDHLPGPRLLVRFHDSGFIKY